MNYSVFTKSNNFAYLKSPPYIFTSSLLSPTLRPNGMSQYRRYMWCFFTKSNSFAYLKTLNNFRDRLRVLSSGSRKSYLCR